MSSNLITADNGVSSGVTGITQSAGSDGTLQLRTTSSGGTATTALTVNNTQYVGIGTTSPSDILDAQRNQNATTNFYFRNTDTTNTNSRNYLNVISGNVNTQLRSINADNSYLCFSGATNGLYLYNGSSATHLFNNNGNLQFQTSNAGIVFDPSSSGTGTNTSTTLNDYETGTWTPTLGGTSTLSTARGTYTKVGNYVFVAFDFTVSSIGSANGWTISGLPFSGSSPSNGLGYVGSLCYGYYANLNISVTSLSGYMNSNTNNFYLTATTSASTTINQNAGPNAVLTTGSRLIGSLVYQANF